jgi:hypothetical protein
MGPPPSQRGLSAGRYNRLGRAVLYLSTSQEGAAIETLRGDAKPFCLQEYSLPISNLRLADFSSADAPSFVQCVFDLAESAVVEGRQGPDDYAFGHLLANLTQGAGFDGMLVCGVLGNPGFHYVNVVIFDPAGWKEWSLGPRGFQRNSLGKLWSSPLAVDT